jgi:hypothetical protein
MKDEILDEINNRVFNWYKNFVGSTHFAGLSKVEKKYSSMIIGMFTNQMYLVYGEHPEEWDPISLQDCCIDISRDVLCGSHFHKAIVPVLSSFFSYLGTHNILGNSDALISGVKEIKDDIVQIGASLLRLEALAKNLIPYYNIDPNDEDEMCEFIDGVISFSVSIETLCALVEALCPNRNLAAQLLASLKFTLDLNLAQLMEQFGLEPPLHPVEYFGLAKIAINVINEQLLDQIRTKQRQRKKKKTRKKGKRKRKIDLMRLL